jgi:hypothetical protein
LAVGLTAPTPDAAAAEERPFKARLAGNALLSPTDDPCVMRNEATASGNATHAGRFTWATEEVVNFCTVPGGVDVAGSFTMTTADGDQVHGRFTAVGQFDETGSLLIDGHYEVVGGTGRFATATGSGDTDVTASFFPGLPFMGTLSGTINY